MTEFKRKNSKHTEEFKREAVTLQMTTGKTVKETAKSLGISTASFYQWKRKYAPKNPEKEQTVEKMQEKLSNALKELEILRQENEILVKATAFFARRNQ